MCLSFSTSLPALRNVPQRAGQERTGGREALSEAATSTRGAAAKPSPTHPTLRGTREKSSKLRLLFHAKGSFCCHVLLTHHIRFLLPTAGERVVQKAQRARNKCLWVAPGQEGVIRQDRWHEDKRGYPTRLFSAHPTAGAWSPSPELKRWWSKRERGSASYCSTGSLAALTTTALPLPAALGQAPESPLHLELS